MTDIEAKARADIARILGNDPIAVGRFTQATEDALVALVTTARAEAVPADIQGPCEHLLALEKAMDALSDPTAVHRNMLRGGIAKPSPRNIWHLYGDDALIEAMPESAKAAIRTLAQGAPEQDGGGVGE